MRRLVGLLLLVCLLTCACQRAHRYGPVARRLSSDNKPEAPDKTLSWLATELDDTPILFVPATAKDKAWDKLTQFWNFFPAPPGGVPSIHIGLDPLNASVALVAAQKLEVVHIKVPFGLPDPTPNIPSANPPTVGAWKLGKEIFFAKLLADGKFSCADCHRPAEGFAGTSARASRNTLSLINCIYNDHQFWDGRVRALEEILVKSLENEMPPSKTDPSPEKSHVWGGLAKKLGADPVFVIRFKSVYDVDHPTQDTIAKALATYMRTILSGNSLYDRARAEADRESKTSPEALPAAKFEKFLDEQTMKSLGAVKEKEGEVARMLEKGNALFFGRANCSSCHKGPLFRDGDFHNTGVAGLGEDEGRFSQIPIGLKENRFVNAFRTPTLRALPRTAPYLHNGSLFSLEDVIAHYGNVSESPFLAKELIDPERPPRRRPLELSKEETRALELFLRSLDGEPVDAAVTQALPKSKKE